ncbi:nuclear transport factor 2 family protein [uncultured Mycobacterium sp.]|uniref:nuclear transport factor 2 family protein n=1 Tax=uncultured Mycobacterium sp. TaxID=171292 RepID=UPI0035CA22D3
MDNTLTSDLIAYLKEAKDRQEIGDCLLRYTRGIDRADKELMQSAYHVDAIDEHGVASGSPEEFCDWAIGYHTDNQRQHHHIITNTMLDLDGEVAHGETYCMFWGDNRVGPPTLSFGRYIDRFEKRNGAWGIVRRVCINEQTTTLGETNFPPEFVAIMKSTGPSLRSLDDISYDRPLLGSRTTTSQEQQA